MWVLIVVSYMYGASALVTFQEFSSLEKCGIAVKAISDNVGIVSSNRQVTASCVEK